MISPTFSSINYRYGFLLAFVIGFFVRLIPELLSFPFPIGWDTVYYAYRIANGVLFGFWDNVFSSWIVYGFLILLETLTKLDPFILLKIVAPLLYGGTSTGIYFVATKKLNWCSTKSLLRCGGSFFLTFFLKFQERFSA